MDPASEPEPKAVFKHRAVSELKPSPENARTHSPEQIEKIKASILAFGFLNPVIISKDNFIIAGHGRIEAAKALGITTVPTMRADHLTDVQRRAYMLADNRIADDGGYDEEILAREMKALFLLDFDLGLTGFEDDELAELLNPRANLTDEDDAPDPPAIPKARLGETWLLGKHRLRCGDTCSPEDVKALFGDKKAVLCQTDPPYGIAYVKNAQTKGRSRGHADIENDELDGPKLQAFLEASIRAALPNLELWTAFYFWHPMLTQGTFFAAAAAADILISRQIIWVKPSMVFGRGDYHWQHELCFYGWQRGNKPPFYGERNQTTIWNIDRETSKLHPTAKPVDLWRAPIKNHTKAGEI
ncbi:MAG TPA: ParB N-terminal domain-containing protein, partial [Pyrinomonadaceae bacterium]|nr:ParB N-terminal domain-containing protein [Pyrinomonadaceae bacterium]